MNRAGEGPSPNSHVAYVENVPEGAEAEQVIRSLARKGFNLILTTSFGYMDPTETVAAEFPNLTFIHISGYKTNGTNFGNLFGAMEDMKYLAGMVAGSRAQVDNNPKLGYIATFPIPEELRLGKTVRSAVDSGYDKALFTIIDSHVTTLITSVVLFQFGTGPIKGFAVTLSLGVIINLFSALIGTKVIFDWINIKKQLTKLSI